MILIGIGSNLGGADEAALRRTCELALDSLAARGIRVVARAPWYRSAPVPASDQRWYVNGVADVETDLGPAGLLGALHAVEAAFGRPRRRARNEARIIDLDLLDYGGMLAPDPQPEAPILPHPRLHERAFVLYPLRDLVPDWRHPALGLGIDALIGALDGSQRLERLPDIAFGGAQTLYSDLTYPRRSE